MLFTLVKNEIIKTFRRPKTIVVTVLFALFTCLMVWLNYYSERQEAKYNNPQTKLDTLKSQKDYIDNDSKDAASKLSGEKKEQFLKSQEERKKSIDAQIALYEKQIASPNESEKWKAELDAQIVEVKSRIDDENVLDKYKASLKSELKNLEYYKDNNLKPISENYLNGSNYITILMTVLGQVFLVIGLAVFMSDIVSGECTPATMKFLLIQPIKKGKVLFSKFIATVISSIGLILSIEAIVMGVVSLFRGFGYASMPVQILAKYAVDLSDENKAIIQVAGTGQNVEQWKFILLGFLLQALFIFAVCSFVFMVSSVVKSSMISMAVSVLILIIAPVLLQSVGALKKGAHLVFTTYSSPLDLLGGRLVHMYSNVNVTVQTGIVVLLVTSIISYLIAHIVFTKKDILI